MFELYLKDTHKRARKMKFTSFFSQRVQYMFELYLKDTHKRARKTKFTSFFHSECSVCSSFSSKILICISFKTFIISKKLKRHNSSTNNNKYNTPFVHQKLDFFEKISDSGKCRTIRNCICCQSCRVEYRGIISINYVATMHTPLRCSGSGS